MGNAVTFRIKYILPVILHIKKNSFNTLIYSPECINCMERMLKVYFSMCLSLTMKNRNSSQCFWGNSSSFFCEPTKQVVLSSVNMKCLYMHKELSREFFRLTTRRDIAGPGDVTVAPWQYHSLAPPAALSKSATFHPYHPVTVDQWTRLVAKLQSFTNLLRYCSLGDIKLLLSQRIRHPHCQLVQNWDILNHDCVGQQQDEENVCISSNIVHIPAPSSPLPLPAHPQAAPAAPPPFPAELA